jgi:hypothetical protein
VVLLALWWVARDAWAAGFRAVGNALAWTLGAGQRVQFRPFSPPPGAVSVADTAVWMFGLGRAEGSRFEISSLRYGYIPLAAYASLVFAAHRPVRSVGRRAVAAGFAGVLALVLLSVAVTVVRMSIRGAELAGRPPGGWATAVELAYRVLVNAPAFEYVVPGFIWLATRALGMPEGSAANPKRGKQRQRR